MNERYKARVAGRRTDITTERYTESKSDGKILRQRDKQKRDWPGDRKAESATETTRLGGRVIQRQSGKGTKTATATNVKG